MDVAQRAEIWRGNPEFPKYARGESDFRGEGSLLLRSVSFRLQSLIISAWENRTNIDKGVFTIKGIVVLKKRNISGVIAIRADDRLIDGCGQCAEYVEGAQAKYCAGVSG